MGSVPRRKCTSFLVTIAFYETILEIASLFHDRNNLPREEHFR